MIKISNIKVDVMCKDTLSKIIADKLEISEKDILSVKILRKSIDARRRTGVSFVYTLAFEANNESHILIKNPNIVQKYKEDMYTFETNAKIKPAKVVVIGSGPAGLFCALMLARTGIKPIILERGEDVDARSKTVEDFKNGLGLNTNSNIQFGEGGAGTFSDGKLNCGVHDKRAPFILNEFYKNGAPEEVTYLAKPHVGTDYLKIVIKSIRSEIISRGGEFLFNTLFTDFDILGDKVCSVRYRNIKTGKTGSQECDFLVLAIGHSARDTYSMLYQKGLNMQKKPFSVGVRIEHKREYINMLRYRNKEIAETLSAADYKLSCHPDGRGAYTFCMCPGGVVVGGASEQGGVVTNGMSNFARDDDNSNSAVLVSVLPEDIEGDSPLDAVKFQRDLERKAFELGGGNYYAPCQMLKDFLAGVASQHLGDVKPSYLPGVTLGDVSKCLPKFVVNTLKKAFLEFDKSMKGFAIDDAVVTGVETRSSAPVRIVRDDEMQSNVKGIFPIGEGAGYAGGIMSSATDGIKCAEQIIELLKHKE